MDGGDAESHYELTLFVHGASALSRRAIANARAICETHLSGRCDLTVLDLIDHPGAVRDHRVVAAPTVIKTSPLPERRFVGDLAQTDRVLRALGLPGGDDTHEATS